MMQAAINDCQLAWFDTEVKSDLRFSGSPLLRYDDPTRGLLDAAVWRLGETGRPVAVVTLESYRLDDGRAKLTYELVSLSASPFSLVSPRGVKWTPSASDFAMAALPDAPQPGDTPTIRLTQVRAQARRFSAHETSGGNRVECRLLPQPIDRYSDQEHNLVDGAMFVFAKGTNPELALILECNGQGWSYGIFRLSSAPLFAKLDGEQIYTAPWFNRYSVSSPYTAAGHAISPEP